MSHELPMRVDRIAACEFTGIMAYRLAIIGGGNMGSAIARGAVAAGILQPGEMIVAEIDASRRAALAMVGCATTASPANAAAVQYLLLAVKPQAFEEVATSLAALPSGTIVISIMAGLGSERIRAALGGRCRIIRAMPNMPCLIGAGMTALALGAGAQPGDESLAAALFGALGRTVMVEESHMHAVTAVSGSGPAYIFLLAEAMEQAALELGLPPSTARLLVEQTVMGAGRLLVETGRSTAELRGAVASPAGTTAAALAVMFERELPQIITEALRAARDRGMELEGRSDDV